MEDRYLKDVTFTLGTGLSDEITITLNKTFGHLNSTTIDKVENETETLSTQAIKDAYNYQEKSF